MRKRIFVFLWIILFFLCLNTEQPIWAQTLDESLLRQQLETMQVEEIESVIRHSGETENVYFQDLLISIMKGELDLSPKNIVEQVLQMFFREVYHNSELMRNLLIIAILSALLKNLTESFKNKGVGELGFYVCYIILIMVLMTSFGSAMSIAKRLITILSNLMMASVPMMMGLIFMSGEVSSPHLIHPVIMFMVNFITLFINYFLAPFIVLTTAIEIVNYMTEKQMLGNFAGLLKKICNWLLKGISILFLSILSLQKISSPIINKLTIKTAKVTLGAIPVVGDVMNGATDVVLYWAQAIKSSALVALIIVIVLLCMIPVIQILALIAIFKFTAAVIEPVCDARIVSCINAIGSYCYLLLGCCITVIVMFILAAVILLSF